MPWIKLSILPSITSWTRETGKTPLFASESLVKSDGGGLSDFATGPSPFPDTPWQEAQDRRNSFRPGFSSGCACRTSIVPIVVEAANKITHHVVRMSLRPLRFARLNRSPAAKNTTPARRLLLVQPLQNSRLNSKLPRAHARLVLYPIFRARYCFMEMPSVERKLVAILAADVVGYKLMKVDETGTFARLKTHRLELIDPTIAKNRGVSSR